MKIKLAGSSPAQSSATRHWKFSSLLYPVTLYIHIPCHETLKCPPIPGCGIWPTDVNQHPRQGWNALTQLGSLAFYLCHWPEKTLPGLPTRSSGLTGDMWSRYESQPKPRSTQLPAKPSLAQPTYRLISKRSASPRGHWELAAVRGHHCSHCQQEHHWGQCDLGQSLSRLSPTHPLWSKGGVRGSIQPLLMATGDQENWDEKSRDPSARISSRPGGRSEETPAGTVGRRKSLVPGDCPGCRHRVHDSQLPNKPHFLLVET